MERVRNRIEAVRQGGGKALALFLTAGFPEKESAVELVPQLAEAGADIVELGMPFSDPLADGPVIQASSTAALKNGMTVGLLLEQVRAIRLKSDVPIVLMGYLNPIMRYGSARFFKDAEASGVDGLILPELPLEESGRFGSYANGIARILLVTPTTPPERIRAIDAASSGFVYCVATTGVTGDSGKRAQTEYLARVKANATKNPVLVGFGISTPDDARRAAEQADGVIIGSALIRKLNETLGIGEIVAWVKLVRAALRVERRE
ncbi:MAG: tryptophan synthase subunit alpha [Bacteroidota bacterium]